MSIRLGFLPLFLVPLLSVAACAAGGGGGSTTGTGGNTTATSTGGGGTTTGSTATSTTTGSTTTSTTGSETTSTTGSTTSTTTTSTTSGTGGADGGLPADAAVVRVHYPAGTHSVTIRGSAGGLSWTTGQPTTASGNTFSYTVSGLTGPVEWKPLLDDTTWARGPNYHVAPGQTVDVWPHFTSTKGQVVTQIAAFHSTVLGNDRPIYAYLPASYAENTEATYPVVYMHDGQNLWAAHPEWAFSGTWDVDTAFDQASEVGTCSVGGVVGWGAQPLGGAPVTCTGDGDCPSGECRTFPEAIVIGVANTADRIYEYTPTNDPTTPGGGGADLYLQMMIQELKPTIDGLLRTRPDVASTALSGSSLGGLVSAYAGIKHADVYGLIGALSPSTWWDNDVIVDDVKATPPAPGRPRIVYVDSGQGTVDDEADTNLLAAAYLSIGYIDGTNFRHVVQPGAQHSEMYWAQRFPGAMQLLLGVR